MPAEHHEEMVAPKSGCCAHPGPTATCDLRFRRGNVPARKQVPGHRPPRRRRFRKSPTRNGGGAVLATIHPHRPPARGAVPKHTRRQVRLAAEHGEAERFYGHLARWDYESTRLMFRLCSHCSVNRSRCESYRPATQGSWVRTITIRSGPHGFCSARTSSNVPCSQRS